MFFLLLLFQVDHWRPTLFTCFFL